MIEAIVLIYLCKGNSRRALERGKSKGSAIAYTIGLWAIFGIIGGFIGFVIFDTLLIAYLFSLGIATAGGVISYLLSKQGSVVSKNSNVSDLLLKHGIVADKKGEAIYYNSQHHGFSSPCTVRINFDSSSQEKTSNPQFTLNGEHLKTSGSLLSAVTKHKQNLLLARSTEENELLDKYSFVASSGSIIDIHFFGGLFQPGLTEISYPDSNSIAENENI